MSLGGFVAATSLFYAGRCSTRYAPLSLLIIVWYAMLDLTLRGDFEHEQTPFLLRWLRRSGLALAASSVWGIMVGAAFGSPATTLLFAGVLVYGISGFFSALFASWLWFPVMRKRHSSADAHHKPA
jgi:hypothetical protein